MSTAPSTQKSAVDHLADALCHFDCDHPAFQHILKAKRAARATTAQLATALTWMETLERLVITQPGGPLERDIAETREMLGRGGAS